MTRACTVGIGALALLVPAARAQADGGRPGYSAADVHFVTGMIAHHAQAVLIAGWAPTHDASPALRALCERIVVGQRDEIAIMQRWLEERHQPVPDSDSRRHTMRQPDERLFFRHGQKTELLALGFAESRGRHTDTIA